MVYYIIFIVNLNFYNFYTLVFWNAFTSALICYMSSFQGVQELQPCCNKHW